MGRAASLFAAAAQADWNVGDPYKMHYPQLPDTTPTGLDVLAGQQTPNAGTAFKIVADDFLCTETGPITDIHIWGSWLSDHLPQNNPNDVLFKLSIDANVPAPPTGGYSQPGATLWSSTFSTGTFTSRVWSTGPEGFYDPNIQQVIGTDTTDYQYNFQNIPDPFVQQQGTIYWLDVQAVPLDTERLLRLEDNQPASHAPFHGRLDVRGHRRVQRPIGRPSAPNVYPSGHPYAGLSMDQAFVITSTVPEPGTLATARRRRHRAAGLRVAKADRAPVAAVVSSWFASKIRDWILLERPGP